jgi:preprotein translocase subunit YajC
MDVTLRAAFLTTAMVTAIAAAPVFAQLSAPAAATPAQAAASAPAPAATASIAAGASVMDSKGGAVGSIESVSGDVAVVNTGTVKASIPVTSFAKSDKGLLIGMTKAELEAAAAGAQAQANAALKPGTAVVDAKGGAVGTIEAVEGDLVTVATPNVKAKLPKSAIAMGPNGAVISMTQAQLEAAAKSPAAPAG